MVRLMVTAPAVPDVLSNLHQRWSDFADQVLFAVKLIELLQQRYAGALARRYGIAEEGSALQVLEEIARVRGCLKKGEELDYAKASLILFDDFRSGKIGRITLEWVE